MTEPPGDEPKPPTLEEFFAYHRRTLADGSWMRPELRDAMLDDETTRAVIARMSDRRRRRGPFSAS